MTYVVAITRWGRPLDQELPDLAQITGVQPYDLRLRLSGALPAVIAKIADPDEARKLMATLRQRRHGAVACDLDRVPSSDQMMAPRNFELCDTSMNVTDANQGSDSVDYSELLALVHAQLAIEERVTITNQSRKFSAGRAVMTGGLVMSKKVTRERREVLNEYEQVLYVFRKSGRDPWVLRQNRLHYAGLGNRIGHSSMESFSTLISMLRERAPKALYDNRLLTRRRPSTVDRTSETSSAVRDKQAVARLSSSNVSETDLAAHLLAVACYRGQL